MTDVLFCLCTAIIGVESVGGLRVLAVNILGRFLGNKDNNLSLIHISEPTRPY